VNAYPLVIELVPRERRGVLAALLVFCMALGWRNRPFERSVARPPGKLPVAVPIPGGYAAAALVAVRLVPRGAGEAETGPGSRAQAAGAIAV
jgi:hypothetical protein